MTRSTPRRHLICLSNAGYRASLVVRRVYTAIPDPEAETRGLVRVIDESGEDYLFPEKLFAVIELPASVARALRDEPAIKPLQRTAQSRRR